MRIGTGTYTSIKLHNKKDIKALLAGFNAALKGLSHEIDFKNFDRTLKNLT
jgi:hypothetical protein